MADQMINLHDFYAKDLEGRLALARREYPGMKVMYVGRPSILRNTHELRKEDHKDPVKRAESIAAYKLDLWRKIKAGHPEVLAALRTIGEETILACWCYPLPCHSQVIWAAWHWLKSKEAVRPAEVGAMV